MKKLILSIIFIVCELNVFAGEPYVGVEGSFGSDFDDMKTWVIGVVGGYRVPILEVVSFEPEARVGYFGLSDGKAWLGGHGPAIISAHFTGSLRANLGVRIFKGLSLITAPSVNYVSGESITNWQMAWRFGLRYRFGKIAVGATYEQSVTRVFNPHVNSISAGLNFYL